METSQFLSTYHTYHQVRKNDEVFAISTNQINRFFSQRLGLCEKKIGSTCSRQTAPKRVRRNRGQIRRFRELDGTRDLGSIEFSNNFLQFWAKFWLFSSIFGNFLTIL